MVKSNEITVIEKQVCSKNQGTYCIYIYKIKNKKLKLEIYADSVDYQSYARAWLFTGSEWKLIYEIPYSLMKTEKDLIYTSSYQNNTGKNLAENIAIWNQYKEDLTLLKQKAENIIF